MKSETKNRILETIKKVKQIGPSDISEEVGISRQMTQRYLRKMIEENLVQKIGTPPKVFYKIKKEKQEPISIVFTEKITNTLNTNFYNITPTGKELIGKEGFISWCLERNFDIQKKSQEFFKIVNKYQNLKENNLLNATQKLKKTFKKGADELYYHDFYSVEVFGKTKTGQKLLYAKQSENKKLIKEITETIKPLLMDLIKRKKIDAIAYVPPTIPRKTQFMKVLEKELGFNLPKIKITKIFSDIRVPQKTLKKLKDRIENADETFVVEKVSGFKNILLIDDAVGSGASINQIAQQMKEKDVAKKVFGFAVTGSLNDFDVISEV